MLTIQIIQQYQGQLIQAVVQVPVDCTVGLALQQWSDTLSDRAQAAAVRNALEHKRVGVWSRLAKSDQALQERDRIELYEPLVFDPMDSRRRRHAHALAKKAAAKAAKVQT